MRNPYKIPPVSAPLKIGLFGGSFNPPHAGHQQVSHLALRRLNLDQIWWLVTPGNPLKDHDGLLPLEERINLCRQINKNPAIKITGFEARYNTRYTADSLNILLTRRPLARFVWIMGADNLAGFHNWERWRQIIASVPIAIVDRPGSSQSSISSQATYYMEHARLPRSHASCLPCHMPPAWTFIHGPRSYLSSSFIRNSKEISPDSALSLPSGTNLMYSTATNVTSKSRIHEDTLTKSMQFNDTSTSLPTKSGADNLSVEDLYQLTINSLEDSKASDIQPIDISKKSSIGDYMIIASGRSHRHVSAIADSLLRDLKTAGIKNPRIEGRQNGDWVLIDIGDIIIHLFRPEVREFYNLEKMWMLPISPDTQSGN